MGLRIGGWPLSAGVSVMALAVAGVLSSVGGASACTGTTASGDDRVGTDEGQLVGGSDTIVCSATPVVRDVIGLSGNDGIEIQSGASIGRNVVGGDGALSYFDPLLGINVDTSDDDDITVEGSVGGDVRGGRGDDSIFIDAGAFVADDVLGDRDNSDLSGDDLIIVEGGIIVSAVGGDSGSDPFGGDDTILINGGTIQGLPVDVAGDGGVFGNKGDDTIAIAGGSIGNQVSGNEGNDLLAVTGGTITGRFYGAEGNDTLVIAGGTLTGAALGVGQALIDGGTGSNTIIIDDTLDSRIATALPLGPVDVSGLAPDVAATLSSSFARIIDGADNFSLVNIAPTSLSLLDGSTIQGSGSDELFISNTALASRHVFSGFAATDIRNATVRFAPGVHELGDTTASGSTLDLSNGSATDGIVVGGLAMTNTTVIVDFAGGAIPDVDTIEMGSLSSGGGNVVQLNVLSQPTSVDGILPLMTFALTSPPGLSGTAPAGFTLVAPGGGTSFALVEGPLGDIYLAYFPTGSGMVVDQQAISTPQLVNNVVNTVIDPLQQQIAGVGGALPTQQVTPFFGVWATGRFAASSHDGYSTVTTIGGAVAAQGPTASFDTRETSFLASAQYDVGKAAGWSAGLKVGAFAGYATTAVDIAPGGTVTLMGGDADANSWLTGGYALASAGNAYGMVVGTYAFGDTEVNDVASGARGTYDTDGFTAALIGGYVIQMPGNTGIDLRGGITYADFTGDAFTDSLGTDIGQSSLEMWAGNASATLFMITELNGIAMKPYVQGGVNHRFNFENQVALTNGAISYNDDDTTYFVKFGAELLPNDNYQLSFGVRVDANDDQKAVSGQVGAKFFLN